MYRDNVIGFDELVGDEELIGQDADVAALLAGAAMLPGLAMRPQAQRRPLNINPQAAQQLLAALRGGGAQPCSPLGDPMVVRHVAPSRKLRSAAGFSQSVAAASSATIIVTPQSLFRAEELIIPEAIGVDFNISAITIGQTNLLTGGGVVPAQVFSEKSYRANHLDWPTNQPTQQILITVANTNAAAKTFAGAFYGRLAF